MTATNVRDRHDVRGCLWHVGDPKTIAPDEQARAFCERWGCHRRTHAGRRLRTCPATCPSSLGSERGEGATKGRAGRKVTRAASFMRSLTQDASGGLASTARHCETRPHGAHGYRGARHPPIQPLPKSSLQAARKLLVEPQYFACVCVLLVTSPCRSKVVVLWLRCWILLLPL